MTKAYARSRNLSIAYLPETPVGLIGLAASDAGLAFLEMYTSPETFEGTLQDRGFLPRAEQNSLLQNTIEQLNGYFQGILREFNVSIDWQRFTPFQDQVLRKTCAIPYGQVKTYAEIAREVGKPHAARAVGQVEARNPIPIIIPCHRVIGSDGSLHGYGALGGLETKARLLRLEGVSL